MVSRNHAVKSQQHGCTCLPAVCSMVIFLLPSGRCGKTKCLGELGVGRETRQKRICCATQGSHGHGDNQNIRSSPQLHYGVSSDTIPDEPKVLWSHRHTVHQACPRPDSCLACNENCDVTPTNASVLVRTGFHAAMPSYQWFNERTTTNSSWQSRALSVAFTRQLANSSLDSAALYLGEEECARAQGQRKSSANRNKWSHRDT